MPWTPTNSQECTHESCVAIAAAAQRDHKRQERIENSPISQSLARKFDHLITSLPFSLLVHSFTAPNPVASRLRTTPTVPCFLPARQHVLSLGIHDQCCVCSSRHPRNSIAKLCSNPLFNDDQPEQSDVVTHLLFPTVVSEAHCTGAGVASPLQGTEMGNGTALES